MTKTQFFSIILRSDGRISPKIINESYFNKINKSDLWNDFINYTKNLDSLTIGERVWCYQNDIQILPNCKCCVNPVIISYENGKSLSRYCSAKCAHSDKELRKSAASKRDEHSASIKRKSTMIEKYGVGYNLQRKDVLEKLRTPKISTDAHQYLNDREWLIEHYINQNKTSIEIGEYLQCDYSTVLSYLRKHDIPIQYYINVSSHEREIWEFLDSCNVNYTTNDKTIIKNELDIYIPEKKFAIEINGTYWHSYNTKETVKQINRHKIKYDDCKDIGIVLYQFTDIEIKEKNDIVKSMILNKLGFFKKINARDCNIITIDNETYKEFCNRTHISGYARASVRLALTHNNEIVTALSFNKSRYNKSAEWEIIRFSSNLGCNVRGGFSKLLKHFINQYGTSICTYSDNRFGFGDVYSANGFEMQYTTKSGYQWTDTKVMISRYQCQKSKLSIILNDKFNEQLSESDNMFNNGFRRIWDAGNNFFVYKE